MSDELPRIVYVPGVWDMLHAGHINLLWRARDHGDVLIVGVVTDEGTKRYKGSLPAEPVWQRMEALKRLQFVDVVAIQLATDPTPELRRFRPAVLVHADGDGQWSQLREQVAAAGVVYVNLPYTQGISSTLLRNGVGGGKYS